MLFALILQIEEDAALAPETGEQGEYQFDPNVQEVPQDGFKF